MRTLLLSLFLLLAGAPAMAFEPPQVSLTGLALSSVSLQSQQWTLTLSVHNPNPLPATLEGVHYQVDVAGTRFGEGRVQGPVTLTAGGSATVTTRVSTALLQTLQQLGPLTPGQPVPYRLQGEARVAELPFPIPLDHQGSLDWPGF